MPAQDDTSEVKVEVSPAARRRRQWGYFRRYAPWFGAGALALVATNALGLAIPAQIGAAVQALEQSASSGAGLDEATRGGLIDLGELIIALAIGAGIARIFSRIFIFNAGRFIEFDVRNELYAKLARLDASFHDATPTGDVTSRVTNDVTYIRLLYAISFLHIINTTLAYGIALRKMVAIDVELMLWCLLPYPFMIVLLRKIIHALFNQTKVVQAQLSEISSKVQENLAGVAVVKTFNLQRREERRFGEMNETFYSEGMRLALIRGALTALTVFVAGAGTLIVLAVGAGRVADGSLTLGEFVEFNGYVVALAFPTQAMGWVFSVWHRGQAAFDRVLEILHRDSALAAPASPVALPPAGEAPRGEIRFEGVRFGYDEGDEILKGIDLTIEAGSKVAVVGKTGSGKSTLVKLIARLYDPDEGRVLLDGEDVRDVELRLLRSELGYVPQEPFLFSMTIEQNIRFGLDALEQDETLAREAPTRSLIDPSQRGLSQRERIEQAVEVAGLAQDIELFPEGLDTLVGERGITLSGGQKQRVTIARALLTDPRVLVLDDSLSSVDTQTESVILDHLDEIMSGRTSIILTHRYNALSGVDCVLVMDEGRIVEQGSHEELLERGGLYAQMYEQQKLRESLES